MTPKLVPHLPFFYHFICHTCKEVLIDIKTCSGCQLVSYCSIHHQKADWKTHKDLCKIIQKLLKEWKVTNIFGIEAKTIDEWRHIRLSLISYVEQELSRPLHNDEKQIFYFPNVCRICFSAKMKSGYKCSQCMMVGYCSEEHHGSHINIHLVECNELKKCFVIDRFCSKLKVKPTISETCFKYPFLDKKTFPNDILSYLNNYIQVNDVHCSLLTESMSGVLSIVFSIFSSKNLLLSTSKECLEIHIIGASSYEYNFLQTIEILFHCISSLKELSIVFIGPESLFDITENEVELCETCKKKKLKITVKKLLYHIFISTNGFKKPDAVVAFNCGFSEFSSTHEDTWNESLSQILKFKDIILIFTSYTKKESEDDCRIVKELIQDNDCFYFNKMCYDNPFRSHRPHRDWEFNGKDIFYLNHYINIFETWN